MNIEKLKNNLEKKEYEVKIFENRNDAVDYITKNINNETIAFGGSVTLEEIGLYNKLAINNNVIWHTHPENKTKEECLKEAIGQDIYFSSVNAISEDGEIVNIDGRGNRVAATIYGHKKVYLVLGTNKITEDLTQAIYRARNIAAPKNAKRLGMKTPCAFKSDKCYNCKSKERICSILSIFLEKPKGSNIELIIIKEDLGY